MTSTASASAVQKIPITNPLQPQPPIGNSGNYTPNKYVGLPPTQKPIVDITPKYNPSGSSAPQSSMTDQSILEARARVAAGTGTPEDHTVATYDTPSEVQAIIARRNERARILQSQGSTPKNAIKQALAEENNQQQYTQVQQQVTQNQQATNQVEANQFQSQVNQDIANLPQPTTGGELPGVNPILGAIGAGGAVGGAFGESLPVIGEAAAAIGAPVALTAAAGAALALGAAFSVEEHQKVKEFNRITIDAPKKFQAAINYANAGGNRDVAYRMFNDVKNEMLLNQANLKAETDNSLTKFLGAPGDELVRVSDFNEVQIPAYAADFIQAIQAPNPKNVKPLPGDLGDLTP